MCAGNLCFVFRQNIAYKWNSLLTACTVEMVLFTNVVVTQIFKHLLPVAQLLG